MDKKALSQTLDSLAAHHMPSDLDMLPGIQARLKTHRAFMPILQRRPARLVASLLVGLFLVVTTVYAAQLLIRDPGLQENMVTPLNLSQTKGDVTVTLDWAYADANRIKLGYTVSSDTREIVENWVTNAKLTDQQHPRSSKEFLGVANLLDVQEISAYIYKVEANFDIARLENEAETIDLRLRIMGNHSFEFTVPFNPGIRIEKQPDVTASGLKANIEWAIITPSMTRAYLCYETPEEKMWVADVVLAYDGEDVAREPMASQGYGPNNGPEERWCMEKRFLTSYDTLPHELTLTIRQLHTPFGYTKEDMEIASEVFAKYGLKTEVRPGSSEPGSGYTLSWLSPIPEGEEFGKIWQEARDAMGDRDRVDGPWHLTIRLP